MNLKNVRTIKNDFFYLYLYYTLYINITKSKHFLKDTCKLAVKIGSMSKKMCIFAPSFGVFTSDALTDRITDTKDAERTT